MLFGWEDGLGHCAVLGHCGSTPWFWYAGAIFLGFIAQQYIFKSSFVGWFVD
jgi:hypothetical protein